MLGYEEHEIGTTLDEWDKRVHPDDKESCYADLERHFSGETPFYQNEHRVLCKDGNYKWILDRGKVMELMDDGKPLRVIGTHTDITERKRLDEVLKQSEEKYRLLIENNYDIIFTLNAEGIFIFVSPAWTELLGHPPAQVIGQSFQPFVHVDDIPVCLEFLQKVFNTGQKQDGIEYRVKHISGEWRWYRANAVPLKDESGKVIGLQGIGRDFTESKRTEDALRESEEKFRTVADFTYDWEYWIDTDGRLIYNSPSCERITGYRSDEFINNPRLLEDIIHQEDHSLVGDHFDTIDSGNPHQVEFRIVTRTGDERWIAHVYQPVFNETGQWLGRRVSNRDITEQKRAEQDRENLRAQLLQSQKMATMGTLAMGIAHDFNNMLTVILGYSSFLLADKNEKDPGYEGLQKIVKTAQDAADLVQRIRISGRRAEMNLVPLDLNHQVDEVTKLLSSTLPKMIEMDIHLTKDPVIIKADPSQITQMVMNLAVNANEAMPQGGRLSIQTENIVLDNDYCQLHLGVKPGSHVMLTVSDSGRGIDKGLMERIFDPFYSTKTRDYRKGTGLGLSVVQGIVQQHGGHITVESEVGKGTTFKMYFPALKDEILPEYVEKKIPYSAGGTETILLVEDWEAVRELGVLILEKFGYTVLSASDGQEALDVYEKEQGNISLVILDIIMPRMDGKQCLEQLLRINPDVKVIISSGVGQYDLINEVVELGAKGVVNKPYGMRQLLAIVREALDRD